VTQETQAPLGLPDILGHEVIKGIRDTPVTRAILVLLGILAPPGLPLKLAQRGILGQQARQDIRDILGRPLR